MPRNHLEPNGLDANVEESIWPSEDEQVENLHAATRRKSYQTVGMPTATKWIHRSVGLTVIPTGLLMGLVCARDCFAATLTRSPTLPGN